MLIFNNNLGRLGNQMFTYATLTAICRRKNIKNYIFTHLGSLQYFELTPRENVISKFKIDFLLKTLFRLFFIPRVRYMDHSKQYSDAELDFSGTKYISAGLQGESYFKDIEGEIKDRFSIKPQYQQRANAIYAEFQDGLKNVCVHIRRGDYLTFMGKNFAVPLSYYQQALENLSPKTHRFIFITDDREYVQQQFGQFPHTYFSQENEITDFQLMMKAEICILANSTFSWWAAWLNSNPNKRVTIPRYFMGIQEKVEFPNGIIPPDWIQIPNKD